MRCVECKDYLYQYRSKAVASNPARVALILAASLAIVAIACAFLPFIEISGVFERRLADSPDGLAAFGAGLVVLIAVAIDGFAEVPRYAKAASLFAGLLLIATVAFDIHDLKTRTSELLQSVNALTAAFLPKFAKLTVMDLIGSGVYSELATGAALVILGLFGPSSGRSPSFRGDPGMEAAPSPWRLSVNPIATWSLVSLSLLLAAYSYASYRSPHYALPPPGREIHTVMARLDPGRLLPDRVVESVDVHGPTEMLMSQAFISVYRFNFLTWDLIFRSPGDGNKGLITDYADFLNSDGGYSGYRLYEFLGTTRLGSRADYLVFMASRGLSEAVHVVAWRDGRLKDMLSVDNGNFSVKVSDDKLLLRGSGYAEGDLPELPSIKNDEATITGDRDGIHVVGGTYRSHWGGTPF